MKVDIKMDNKKNILLVTLFDDNNIGNRLQNYALQHTLELYNTKVSIIDNGYTNHATIKFKIKVIIKKCLGIIGVDKYRYSYQQYLSSKAKRVANEEFDKNNIHYSLCKKCKNKVNKYIHYERLLHKENKKTGKRCKEKECKRE